MKNFKLHFATGKSGTIGKHLEASTLDLSINLQENFSQIEFGCSLENANVTHLAGVVGEKLIQSDPKMAREVNVNGTLRLAEKLLELKIGRFTYVSTSHVYATSDKPIKEDWPVNPLSEYANQKLETETELMNLFRNSDAELTVLRIFSILDWDVKEFTLGGAIARAHFSGKRNSVRFGDDVRDFLTPRSAAKILESVARTSEMAGVWNVCSGKEMTIREAGLRMIGAEANDGTADIFEEGNSAVPFLVGCNQKLLSYIPSDLFTWHPSNNRKPIEKGFECES